jgi:excisionase family DNA binding protein
MHLSETKRATGRVANNLDTPVSSTVKDVAERHQFSLSFVYQAVSEGRLRATRAGGQGALRILPEDELRWLKGLPPRAGSEKQEAPR